MVGRRIASGLAALAILASCAKDPVGFRLEPDPPRSGDLFRLILSNVGEGVLPRLESTDVRILESRRAVRVETGERGPRFSTNWIFSVESAGGDRLRMLLVAGEREFTIERTLLPGKEFRSDLRARRELSKNALLPGEIATLDWVIEGKERIESPSLERSGSAALQIRPVPGATDVKEGRTLLLRETLWGRVPGRQRIPSALLRFRDSTGALRTLEFPALEVEIRIPSGERVDASGDFRAEIRGLPERLEPGQVVEVSFLVEGEGNFDALSVPPRIEGSPDVEIRDLGREESIAVTSRGGKGWVRWRSRVRPNRPSEIRIPPWVIRSLDASGRIRVASVGPLRSRSTDWKPDETGEIAPVPVAGTPLGDPERVSRAVPRTLRIALASLFVAVLAFHLFRSSKGRRLRFPRLFVRKSKGREPVELAEWIEGRSEGERLLRRLARERARHGETSEEAAVLRDFIGRLEILRWAPPGAEAEKKLALAEEIRSRSDLFPFPEKP